MRIVVRKPGWQCSGSIDGINREQHGGLQATCWECNGRRDGVTILYKSGLFSAELGGILP